jgi:hypothetical protein
MISSGNFELGQWRKLFSMFKSILMQSLNIFELGKAFELNYKLGRCLDIWKIIFDARQWPGMVEQSDPVGLNDRGTPLGSHPGGALLRALSPPNARRRLH